MKTKMPRLFLVVGIIIISCSYIFWAHPVFSAKYCRGYTNCGKATISPLSPIVICDCSPGSITQKSCVEQGGNCVRASCDFNCYCGGDTCHWEEECDAECDPACGECGWRKTDCSCGTNSVCCPPPPGECDSNCRTVPDNTCRAGSCGLCYRRTGIEQCDGNGDGTWTNCKDYCSYDVSCDPSCPSGPSCDPCFIGCCMEDVCGIGAFSDTSKFVMNEESEINSANKLVLAKNLSNKTTNIETNNVATNEYEELGELNKNNRASRIKAFSASIFQMVIVSIKKLFDSIRFFSVASFFSFFL